MCSTATSVKRNAAPQTRLSRRRRAASRGLMWGRRAPVIIVDEMPRPNTESLE
jgi:hypothetical protein